MFEGTDKARLFRWSLYLLPILPLLIACFCKQITEFHWRVQESWGMAPRNLIRDPQRYFSVGRYFGFVMAAALLVFAYWQDCQWTEIEKQIAEADRRTSKLLKFYKDRPVVPNSRFDMTTPTPKK